MMYTKNSSFKAYTLKFTFALAALTSLLMACGKNDGGGSTPAAAPAAVVCQNQPGTIYSQVYNSCIQQSTCAAGCGLYNNQCVNATNGTACLNNAGLNNNTAWLNNNVNGTNSCQANCNPGQVLTNINGTQQCLPVTAACGSCQGSFNGTCYPAVNQMNVNTIPYYPTNGSSVWTTTSTTGVATTVIVNERVVTYPRRVYMPSPVIMTPPVIYTPGWYYSRPGLSVNFNL